MADETLRRNLEAAFDPGPDFPDPLLLSRTMAAVNAEVGSAAGGMNRKSRAQYSSTWTRPGLRISAILVAVIVAVAATATFLAAQKFFSSVPAQPRPSPVSRSCSQGNLHMMTSSTGWNGTSRTTDGGVTWRDVSPPWFANETEGGRVACYLDADHAWMTEIVGASSTTTGRLLVFETRNGGLSWQESDAVPIGESNNWPAPPMPPAVQLQFIDARHGWLVTDAGYYTSGRGTTNVYTTMDGGLHWSQVATSEGIERSYWLQQASSCRPSGMTFLSLSQGWLTWDCTAQPFSSPATDVVLVTDDGGRSWGPNSINIAQYLAGWPDGGPTPNTYWACAASAPVFGGGEGILLVGCAALANRDGAPAGPGWSATLRTDDGGATWNLELTHPTPGYVGLSQLDFVDSNAGYAFVKTASGNDLYRTNDAGRHWSIVTKGLFSGQNVTDVQFLDATTGFAFTDRSSATPWKTTDGGLTWTLPAL